MCIFIGCANVSARAGLCHLVSSIHSHPSLEHRNNRTKMAPVRPHFAALNAGGIDYVKPADIYTTSLTNIVTYRL